MAVDPELKEKKDEEASQIWASIAPSAKQCRTCLNAYRDTQFTVGAEKANCEIFKTVDKPQDVLWNGADCDFYDREV